MIVFLNLLPAVLPIQLSVHLTFAVSTFVACANQHLKLVFCKTVVQPVAPQPVPLMLFPFQEQASAFPELDNVSIHLFLQPVVILYWLATLYFSLSKGSFEFGEFSEVECIPSSQLIMENLIYCSPQNDKLCVAGWYWCMFFGSSFPLAGLVWLLNFKERK